MKIICVGRNYVDHIKELSNDKPTDPVIFIKPDTALLEDSKFYYPSFSNDVHYELELVFKIGKVGKNIDAKFAHKYIDSSSAGFRLRVLSFWPLAKNPCRRTWHATCKTWQC